MNIIKIYEKKNNVSLSKDAKKYLKSDIHFFVTRKKPKEERPAKGLADILTRLDSMRFDFHIYCATKEEYAKCAESVIIFDLSFEKRIKNLIHAQDAFFDEIHYCSLKRALIHRLKDMNELDEDFCIEMIKSNQAQRIRY